MKKISIISIILLVAFLSASCDKFLELKPKDVRIVKTVEDYRDIMGSFVYMLNTPNTIKGKVLGVSEETYPCFELSKVMSIYTGESIIDKSSSALFDRDVNDWTHYGKRLLTWLAPDEILKMWNQNYEFLGMMNLIIEDIEKVECSDANIRNYVQGEALVWRAYTFYKLLQHFSPYKNNTLGIPVYLKPQENIASAMPKRKTQQEVFTQILGDCNRALELLKTTPTNEWNCAYREDFIHAMMASIYTWKAMSGAAEEEDWQHAITHADLAIGERNLAQTKEELVKMFSCKEITQSTYYESDEFYFRVIDGINKRIFDFHKTYYSSTWSVVTGFAEPEHYNMYKENDKRRSFYFTQDGLMNDKYSLVSYWQGGGCIIPFRLAEMYLIKAEALYREGKQNEAKEMLRQFKSSRYMGDFELPSGGEQLLQDIIDERHREFYMEIDYLWLDMKRLGVEYKRVLQGETNILKGDDFRYTLPIPQSEMETNKNMIQNPGWENIRL